MDSAKPPGQVAPAGTIALPLPLSEQAGDRIGHYKLLQEIGAGGFGVVYMAEQQEPVRRRVALKIIKLGMDTKEVIARFEAERQALALMDHPHIAKVLDAGATSSGRPYFVMELVKGERITEYCDKHNLSTRQRLDLFVQICQAIQHAHQKGIIHRDIKPSNILVAMQDGVPVPKVIDFGIAKATEQRLTDKTFFTALGDFVGTPAYMSPEQAEMSGLDIDTRSDIYSLGVLLYELLTGKTPFDPKELLAKGIEAMRRAIREEEPRRPSTRLTTMDAGELTTTAKRRQTDAPKLVHLVRGDLDWIVMKCLEKDRTRRYETANGLALDLERHIHHEPVLACPPSKAYRFQKMARRNKGAFAAAALIAVVLVAATSISVWQAVRATRAQTLAQQRLADSAGISQFLTEAFQSPDPAHDARTIKLVEKLGAVAKMLDSSEMAYQPARRAYFQANLGIVFYALGLYQEAIPPQKKVLDYYQAVSGPANADTLRAIHYLANSYAGLANSYVEAGRHQEAITLLARACEADPKDTDTSLTLATWQTWFGQDADYEATRRRLVQQAEGTDQAGTAERAAKACCLRPSTDPALLTNALNLARRGVELGKSSSLLPYYQLGLGLAEYRNSQFADAQQDLAVAEQKLRGSSEVRGTARLFRAMSLFRLDRKEEARKLFSLAEAQMPPLPQDESKPLVNGSLVSHDHLICWMAYKEAKQLIENQTTVK